MFKFLENLFKDDIKESIIDIPRRIYAPGVFDDADTDNPKLKPVVLDMIKDQLKDFERLAPVVRYSLIGSILTKRYRNDADLDINVLFDVPESEQEEKRLEFSKELKGINGRLVPGTQHPINYFIITDPKLERANKIKADGVFDIDKNKFIRRPVPQDFDPKKYEKDFQKKVQEIDIIKGELKRDLVDYEELKELTPNDVLNLQDRVNGKLEEIEDSVRTLKDIGDTLVQDRRDIFSRDMTPDEIREYGIHNKLPKNIIYKMLEKYHYMKFYKKLKDILEDDKITDDEIKDLQIHEAEGKTVAFAFGRFNPPTIGHQKLIQKVVSQPANKHLVYLSRSNDPRSNPLPPNEKLKFMKKMFPRYSNMFKINTTNMILDIATSLYQQGYKNINFVAGSDRVREFDTILKKYNDVKSRHGYYNFNNIKITSAGERDPDAEGATGMSASKMRAAVSSKDFASFKKGLPTSFGDSIPLYKAVAKGMKVSLAAGVGSVGHHVGYEFKPVASLEEFEQKQIRDLYIREMIFNVGDKVNYVVEDINGEVKRRGTNYIVIEDNNNNLHKCWIWDCIPESGNREVEMREYDLNVDYGFEAVNERKQPQDKDVEKEPGTQPKKYYKDLKKDTKQKRADFFKKQDTTDTSPDSYKKAPGDETGKTKPSKHTQKYKKMFGELKKDLNDACWSGYKQVGMKKKGKKMVPNCVPEEAEAILDLDEKAKEFHMFSTKKDAEKKAKEIGGKVVTGTGKSKGYFAAIKEATHDCPPAVQNVDLNTKNRDQTTLRHNYGPLNVDEPGDYWEKIADQWKTSVKAAKMSLCANCIAFDISPRMKECMPGVASDGEGELGYCWMHHFKCHSRRSCNTWAKGGPIVDNKISYIWHDKSSLDEAYEIGQDYANHCKDMTPGESPVEKPVDSKDVTPEIRKKRSLKNFTEYLAEVPEEDKYSHLEEELEITEAEYQGKKVKLNDPIRGGSKKFYVYVKNNKGNVIKVSFGDTTGLSIKRDDPERRKSFRARHNCDTAKDKTTARYWSCRMWTARTKVSDLD